MCPVACDYCYARRLYKRFKWNPEIRWDESCLYALRKIKKPSRIFVGSTIELFGDWVHKWALELIFSYCKDNPKHTFIFLTKKPENLYKFSPFPENAWVGVSATNQQQHNEAVLFLDVIKAKVKFISYEPLLEEINLSGAYDLEGIDWVICGQQTPVSIKTMPKVGWVEEIVRAADKAGVKVFLKDNLISCVDQYGFALKDGHYRQEFTEVKL